MDANADLTYEEIAEILKVIESSSIEELHLEVHGIVLDIRRSGAAPRAQASAPAPQVVAAAPVRVVAPTAPPEPGHFSVTSPMLGTFYRARSPGAPPFVEVGSIVRTGDTLAIVEVMKLINTIVATRDGRVVEIPAANGELVEFGQTVMVFEPL